ncbi:MAG: dihydroxyacetone kinase subunit DhaK [Caldilineaceae bacterium]
MTWPPPPEEADRRRGVAGMVFAFKIAGAKADQGGSVDDVMAVTEKALANIRTMGVALSPCTVPMASKPTFTIGDDEMEIGMGIHGEPGMKRKAPDGRRDHGAHDDRHPGRSPARSSAFGWPSWSTGWVRRRRRNCT